MTRSLSWDILTGDARADRATHSQAACLCLSLNEPSHFLRSHSKMRINTT